MPRSPAEQAVRRRSKRRSQRRLTRRANRFDQRIAEGTLTEEQAARKMSRSAERIGSRVGGRVAKRRGLTAEAGARRGANVASRIARRKTARRFPGSGVTPPDAGRKNPRNPGGGDGPGTAPSTPVREGGAGPELESPTLLSRSGSTPPPGVPSPAALANLGFDPLTSRSTGVLALAGPRAALARQARMAMLHRLMSLGDPSAVAALLGLA